MNKVNKENIILCDEIKSKFKDNSKKTRDNAIKIVQEKEKELSEAIDSRIEDTIN